MNKVSIIIRHEFRQKIRSKAFIVMTVLAPILMAVAFGIPILIAVLGGDNLKRVIVVDKTNVLGSYFMKKNTDKPNKKKDSSGLQLEVLAASTISGNTIDSLKKLLSKKDIEGYFVIPQAALSDTNVSATLRLSNTNDFSVEQYISSRYEEGLFSERMRSSGIDADLVRRAQSAHKIETLKVSEGKESSDNGIGFAAGYITGFFIYLSMILYGSLIMQSVIEEKSTRVIELLASSARPMDILIGKVIGVGLAGLLQVSVWATMFAAVVWFALPAILSSAGSSLTMFLSPTLFIYFVLYFLFGYLIYSTLYAGAGATVEQASDAQQVTLPITMLNVISFITLTTVIQAPSSTTSVILSMIPFFSPVLMMGRIFSETPPLWQILLSFVLMGATFFGVLWISARVYRTGILMYGKKHTFREIIKWVRYS